MYAETKEEPQAQGWSPEHQQGEAAPGSTTFTPPLPDMDFLPGALYFLAGVAQGGSPLHA